MMMIKCIPLNNWNSVQTVLEPNTVCPSIHRTVHLSVPQNAKTSAKVLMTNPVSNIFNFQFLKNTHYLHSMREKQNLELPMKAIKNPSKHTCCVQRQITLAFVLTGLHEKYFGTIYTHHTKFLCNLSETVDAVFSPVCLTQTVCKVTPVYPYEHAFFF